MKVFFAIVLILISTDIFSQYTIEAERPSETISPKTLSKNTFQLETGFRKTQVDVEDKVWRHPNLLLRYGLNKKVELRLETSSENQQLVSKNISRNGIRPVELGIKINLIETKNEAFSSAVVGQIGIPKFASKDHQLDQAYHRVRLLFENKLTEKMKLSYNVGSDWDSEDQEQNWVSSFSQEFELTDKLESFVEVYSFFKKNEIPENVIDAGFAYFVSPNAKLDISAGRGLNNESPKYFVAFGFSFKVGGRK